jgi:NAD dependent epimerase/dehydratase family enzyme
MHRPVLFSVPTLALKLLLRDMATELFLAGQRTIPQNLLNAGYDFNYPCLEPALQEIIKKSTNPGE